MIFSSIMLHYIRLYYFRLYSITPDCINIILYYLLASPAFHRPQFFNYFGLILGPFWVHFGSNLGPKWVKMAPRAAKSAPRAPQERPRAPKSRFFHYLIISGGSRKAPGALWERPKTLQEPPGTAQEAKNSRVWSFWSPFGGHFGTRKASSKQEGGKSE